MVDARGRGEGRRHFFVYDDPIPDTDIAPATYAVTAGSSASVASAAPAASASSIPCSPVHQQQQRSGCALFGCHRMLFSFSEGRNTPKVCTKVLSPDQQPRQRLVADDYYSGTDIDTSSDDWNEIDTVADLVHDRKVTLIECSTEIATEPQNTSCVGNLGFEAVLSAGLHSFIFCRAGLCPTCRICWCYRAYSGSSWA